MKKEVKTFAFIDSQNLNLGVKSAGWTLDFKRFHNYLKTKSNISKIYLFIGHVSGNEKLYTFLQESGYILIFKPTLEFKKGNKKLAKIIVPNHKFSSLLRRFASKIVSVQMFKKQVERK